MVDNKKSNVVMIGFKTSKDYKGRIVKAGKKFILDGMPYQLSISSFCRIATEKMLVELERKEVK